MARTYVKLTQLNQLWTDDEEWQKHVEQQGVGEDYTFASDDDDGNYEYADFEGSEMTLLDEDEVTVYNFMGSESARESFYPRDILVFAREDGSYWALATEGFDEI